MKKDDYFHNLAESYERIQSALNDLNRWIGLITLWLLYVPVAKSAGEALYWFIHRNKKG